MKNGIWKRSGVGLYCYQPTGIYFARVRFGGKLYRRALETHDYKLARRKLAEFKLDLERTDASKGKTSFAKVLDAYEATLTGAGSTLEKKRAVVAKLRATWFGLGTLALRTVATSQVSRGSTAKRSRAATLSSSWDWPGWGKLRWLRCGAVTLILKLTHHDLPAQDRYRLCHPDLPAGASAGREVVQRERAE